MFHEESLVTFVFKIINVGVLIGGSLYLFKKYAVKQLRELFLRERVQASQLRELETGLKQSVKEIELEIQAQKQWVKRMESNVTLWKQQLQVLQEKEKGDRLSVQQRLDQRYAHKEKFIAESAIQRIIFSGALSKARNELMKRFSDEIENKTFVAKVITMMRKIDHES